MGNGSVKPPALGLQLLACRVSVLVVEGSGVLPLNNLYIPDAARSTGTVGNPVNWDAGLPDGELVCIILLL